MYESALESVQCHKHSLTDHATHQHHVYQICYDTDYRQTTRFKRESATPQNKHQNDASIRKLLFKQTENYPNHQNQVGH